MHVIAQRIRTRSRKRWFYSRPLFRQFKLVGQADIERIEGKVGVSLPDDLKVWLLSVGYGDVDDTLSFRYDWFHAIDQGQLNGAVIFAQDDLGNFYAYAPGEQEIYFVARSSAEYAVVAPSFRAFMQELERRDFKLGEWMDGIALTPCGGDG